MKRKIVAAVIIIIAFILIVCGFTLFNKPSRSTPKTKAEPQDESSIKIKAMKEKLIEYGKIAFEKDSWLNGNVTPAIYILTLNNIEKDGKSDISMFVNPETNEPCDKEKTRIEFIVKEGTTATHTEYEFRPVLVCGIKGEVDPSNDPTKVAPTNEEKNEE